MNTNPNPKKNYSKKGNTKTPVKEEEPKKVVPLKKVPVHPLDRYYNPITGSRFEILAEEFN